MSTVAPKDMSRVRVSDAERDQAAEVLREAVAEGRLTLDELDERLDAVYSAKTYADLEPLTSDLPGGAGVPAQMPSAMPSAVRPGALSETGDGAALVLNSAGSSVSRKGDWQVPHRIEVHNKYGVTKLDFREARLTGPVTEVHLDASWGGAFLILPEGATAQVDVDASWFGTLRVNVDSLRRTDAPHFVITGSCQGGTLWIRYKRPFSWGGRSG